MPKALLFGFTKINKSKCCSNGIGKELNFESSSFHYPTPMRRNLPRDELKRKLNTSKSFFLSFSSSFSATKHQIDGVHSLAGTEGSNYTIQGLGLFSITHIKSKFRKRKGKKNRDKSL